MAENFTGVKRDSVRSQENTFTEAAAAASMEAQQPQVEVQASSPTSSLCSKFFVYGGMLFALLAGIALCGLGFGMWKASHNGSSGTPESVYNATLLPQGSQQSLPQNISSNATDFSTRYAQSIASFSQNY